MPFPIGAAVTAGIGALGSILTGNSKNKSEQALTREQIAEQRRQFDAAARQRAGETALSATQLDPLKQQKSRQLNALLGQLMQRMKPVQYNFETGKYEGGVNDLGPEVFAAISSFFGPDAMRSAENSFAANAGAASGGQYRAPDLGAAGYATPSGQRYDGTPAGTVTPLPTPGALGIPQARRRDGSVPTPQTGQTNPNNPFELPAPPRGSRTPRVPGSTY